jgi:hypothetical protein
LSDKFNTRSACATVRRAFGCRPWPVVDRNMKSPALAIAISLTAMSSCLVAQSLQTSGTPPYSVTQQTQGRGQASQLVLWSQAEKAQRAPIPFPLAKPTGSPRSQDSSAQLQRVLVGIIERSGRLYILRVSNPTASQASVWVELDDQQRAGRFEGRQVRLTGTLDESTSYIKIDSIELIS